MNSISNPLFISMFGIAATSLAIVLYHMLLVNCCIRRHASNATLPQSTAAGVDEEVLRRIPISPFSAVRGGADIPDDNDDECVVCLGEIEDEDEVRLLPVCGHVFHVACIDRWFAAHASCPVCRSPVVEPANAEDCSATDGAEAATGATSLLSRSQSAGLLESMVERSPPRLKRSLSVDQVLAAIGLRCCGGDILATSGSYGTRSNLRHLDRVSSKMRRSFSRLRVGVPGRAAILPH